MKTWFACLLCLAFTGTVSAADPPAASVAAALSSAMRLDEFFANRWNNVAIEVHRRNQSTPDRITCAATAFKPGDFTAKSPQVLEAMFTPDELAEALKFYDSKLGQRWVDMTFDVFRAKDTGAQRQVKLDRKELEKVQAFSDTPLGSRIANMAKITGSDQARETFGLVVLEAIRRCPDPNR